MNIKTVQVIPQINQWTLSIDFKTNYKIYNHTNVYQINSHSTINKKIYFCFKNIVTDS